MQKTKEVETLENVNPEISVILDKFHLREGKQDFKIELASEFRYNHAELD